MSKLCSVCGRVEPNLWCHLFDFCQVTKQNYITEGLHSTVLMYEVAREYNGKPKMW
jgi:hypothetical protein